MELEAARTLAHQLMDQHGLIGRGWTFDFEDGAYSFGVTRRHHKAIRMSGELTAAATYDQVEQTILHEIAHALTPLYDNKFREVPQHGSAWRANARRIGYRGGAKGADPRLTAKIAHLAVDTPLEVGARVIAIDLREGIVTKLTDARVEYVTEDGTEFRTLPDAVIVIAAPTEETLAVADRVADSNAPKFGRGDTVIVTAEGDIKGKLATIEDVKRTRYVINVPETGKSYYAHFHLVQAA